MGKTEAAMKKEEEVQRETRELDAEIMNHS
jgi:hypothetical protein